jgi:hypothetical protein
MKLLSLDPSSQIIGYAVSVGPNIKLLDAGIITPTKKHKQTIERINDLSMQVYDLMARNIDVANDKIVIEGPAKHVHGRLRGQGYGLAIYGMSVGHLYAVLSMKIEPLLVPSDVWTRKRKKQPRVALTHAEYKIDPDTDKGGDCADAICLAEYYWNEIYKK